MQSIEENKQEFLQIYSTIKREGADKLLEYITNSTDFFTAPASGRRHSAFEGGLCFHALNVYKRLKQNIISEYGQDYSSKISDESIAIIGLLHDICKVNTYTKDLRNKKENGQWIQVPYFAYNNPLPYGHGEKSVYVVSAYMRLTREEAMAINWHMGPYDPRAQYSSDLDDAFQKFPIAVLTFVSDLEASFLDEPREEN